MTIGEFDSFSKPYRNAEITTIYLKSEDTEGACEYVHAFSLVELIPFTQKQSEELHARGSDIKIAKHVKLVIQRKICSIEAAKDYYYSKGHIVLPVYKRIVPIANLAVDSAEGCHVVSNSGLSNKPLEKILPKRSMGYRVGLRLDVQKSFEKTLRTVFGDDYLPYIEKICKRIDAVLFTDFLNYQEFLGGIVLAGQNPFVWAVKRFDEKGSTTWKLVLMPRKGQSICGLKLLFSRKSIIGTFFAKTVGMESPVVAVDMPFKSNEAYVMVWDQDGNLLEDVELQYFGKDGSGKDKELLEAEEEKRSIRRLEKNRTFIYFNAGEKGKALGITKDIIAETHESLIICDPYLRENLENLIERKNEFRYRYHLTVFTSQRIFLRTDEEGKTVVNYTLLEKLITMVTRIKDDERIANLSFYVLCGHSRYNSILHDRYIIQDGKKAWSFGSSFNGFGREDSMLIALPQSKIDSLKKRTEEWIADGKICFTLEEYRKKVSDETIV